MDAAQAGADRVRRRRRAAAITAAAVVVVLAASAAPVALRLRAAHPVPPAGVARSAVEMTISLAGSVPDSTVDRQAEAGRQMLVLKRYSGTHVALTAYVTAFDPSAAGSPPMSIPGAETVTVRGRPAQYIVTRRTPAGSIIEAEARWTDATGLGIDLSLTSDAADRETVLGVAAAVRVGAPQPVAMPFRLGPLPPALTPAMAVTTPIRDPAAGHTPAAVATLEVREPAPLGPFGEEITISATARQSLRGTSVAAVAGHPATYDATSPGPSFRARLAVLSGVCVYAFETTTPAITEPTLRTLAAGTQYVDCTDPSAWIPPTR